MEGYKKKIPSDDPNMVGAFKHIEDNAMGNIIIFKSVPTNDTMKANTLGFWNDELYLKCANGKSYKTALTEIS